MKTQRLKVITAIVVGLIALAGFNAHNLYAMYWNAPGASVWPKGCREDVCAIHGTLRAVPWSAGAYELSDDDGAVTRLPKGSYWKMQYPSKKS